MRSSTFRDHRIASVALGGVIAALLQFAAIDPATAGGPATVVSRGEAVPDVKVPTERNDDLSADSTGSVCAASAAGSKTNEAKSIGGGGTPDSCTIKEKKVDKTGKVVKITPIAGIGDTIAKFTKTEVQDTVVYGAAGTFARSTTTSDESPSTTAEGKAGLFSETGVLGATNRRFFRAQLDASAKVTQEDKDKSPAGLAAAEAKDPMFFEYLEPDILDFEFFLGDGIIDEDDDAVPLPEIMLASDSVTGKVHVDFSADLFGVSLDGTPLDGNLFTLSIDGEGIIAGVGDLAIAFLPWIGLGLSDAEILGVEDFVRTSLGDLGGGVIGLGPGASLALIGDGGALPTLRFDVAGSADMHASAVAEAELVPEPGTLTLLLGGLAAAALARRRLRRRRLGRRG